MASNLSVSHHIRALPPALRAMQAMGYETDACLAGTGIKAADLLAPNPTLEFSLAQEFTFHRNLLRLSADPLLGLRLGKAYPAQSYGLFGYAFLSAPTLRHALAIVSNYGPLSFTLFRIDFCETAGAGTLQFSRQLDIPEDLLTYYVDRDLAAALAGVDPAQVAPIRPLAVALGKVAVDGGRLHAELAQIGDQTVGSPLGAHERERALVPAGDGGQHLDLVHLVDEHEPVDHLVDRQRG